MLYVISACDNGHLLAVKIGYTRGKPEKRLQSLQTGCPHELVLVCSMPGSVADEQAWHARAAGFRSRGEWFYPDLALLDMLWCAFACVEHEAKPAPRLRTCTKSSRRARFAGAASVADLVIRRALRGQRTM